jgi:hypothetical protein
MSDHSDFRGTRSALDRGRMVRAWPTSSVCPDRLVDQYGSPDVLDAEDHRQCHGTCGGRERKKTGRPRRGSRDFVDGFLGSVPELGGPP